MSFRNSRAINTTQRFKAILAIGVKRRLSEMQSDEIHKFLLLSSVFNEETLDLLKIIAERRPHVGQMPWSDDGYHSLGVTLELTPEEVMAEVMADVIIAVVSSEKPLYNAIMDQIDQLQSPNPQPALGEQEFVFTSLVAHPSITLGPPAGMRPPTREEKIDSALKLIAAPFAIEDGAVKILASMVARRIRA